MLSEACSGNGGGRNKSGGRQPAVPTKRARDGERFSPAEYIRAPRLAHASRSCCATRVRCEMRDLLCTNARQQERRASARRGSQWNAPAMLSEPSSGNSGGRNKSGGRQPAVPTKRARDGERFSPAEYIRAPRLAYASRSWLHGVGRLKMTTPALHERSFTRAAGVSPPWICKPRLQLQCAEFPVSRSPAGALHGGLTPPAPGAVTTTVCRKMTIFSMHKRTLTRAAGVSPPGNECGESSGDGECFGRSDPGQSPSPSRPSSWRSTSGGAGA
jgi:hypothetical protein